MFAPRHSIYQQVVDCRVFFYVTNNELDTTGDGCMLKAALKKYPELGMKIGAVVFAMLSFFILLKP